MKSKTFNFKGFEYHLAIGEDLYAKIMIKAGENAYRHTMSSADFNRKEPNEYIIQMHTEARKLINKLIELEVGLSSDFHQLAGALEDGDNRSQEEVAYTSPISP